jgi:hypothetical protein
LAAKQFAFVSYSHKNARAALAIVDRVAKAGYEVWCDRGIKVSSTWTDEIARAIERCEVFIVFLSKDSALSLFVRSEIEYAFQKRKKIVPVYLDPIEELPPGLAIGLNAIQGIVGSSYATLAQKICAALSQNGVYNSSKPSAKKRLAIALTLIGAVLIAFGVLFAFHRDAVEGFAAKLGVNAAPIKTLPLAKNEYAPAEPITFKTDKTIQDKIKNGAIAGVTRVGASDKEWIIIKEIAKPSAPILVRAPGFAGEYEARIYALDGALIAAKRFSVSEGAPVGYKIGIGKNAYAPNEKFSAKIDGVKKDAIDSRMVVGVWHVWADGGDAITKRIVDKKNASIAFVAPSSSGRYEIRAYNNGEILTEATLMARAQINVRKLSETQGVK